MNLQEIAQDLRKTSLQMIYEAGSGHPGGSFSALDLLTALFFEHMNFQNQEDSDRFILSKGHAAPALYAIYAKKAWIPEHELKSFRQLGSRLQGHPDRVRLPRVEASTGSLGQGLSVAQGLALGLRLQGRSSQVFCLLGDGELQEGQVWEACLSAAKYQLSHLCAIVDYNQAQIDGNISEVMPLEPLAQKFQSFGMRVHCIDGHDFSSILSCLQLARKEHHSGLRKPSIIIANTIKGKGVSFMENQIKWHGSAPSHAEFEKAIKELS